MAALLILGALGGVGCAALSRMSGASPELRAQLESSRAPYDPGFARFTFDDFGALNTHTLETFASPWKLFSTALLMSEAPRLGLPVEAASLRPVLEQFGFLFPDSIGNWDPNAGPVPRIAGALGLTRGTIHGAVPGLKLEVANTGCVSCHGGALYDAAGAPTRTAWLGLPNTSLDLDGYSAAVFTALKQAVRDEPLLLRTMQQVYPRMSWGERFVYRHSVFPRLRRELPRIIAARDRALVFDNGGPGITNGVAALKFQLGLIPGSGFAPGEMALTSIPDLSNRAYRTSLLFDGTYAVKGDRHFAPVERARATPEHAERLADIVAFFTIGTSGNDAATAERMIPRFREVMRALTRYAAPPFPGPVDAALADHGAEVFAERCTGCHGRYERSGSRVQLVEYPNRLVRGALIGTDSVRWMAVNDTVLGWYAKHPDHPFVSHIDAIRTGGYVPPILTGVWATAPYLHNGSVPTLWDLMHPGTRPAKFELGGHRLDYKRMGIALQPGADGVWRFPPGYRAVSRSVVIDCSQLGRSNRGHDLPFIDMSEADKAGLLEYLKRF